MLSFLTSWLNRLIPEGYQDASGFHYGKPPNDISDSARVSLTSALRNRAVTVNLPSGGGAGQFTGCDTYPASLLNTPERI